jgi:hypothetical protein
VQRGRSHAQSRPAHRSHPVGSPIQDVPKRFPRGGSIGPSHAVFGRWPRIAPHAQPVLEPEPQRASRVASPRAPDRRGCRRASIGPFRFDTRTDPRLRVGKCGLRRRHVQIVEVAGSDNVRDRAQCRKLIGQKPRRSRRVNAAGSCPMRAGSRSCVRRTSYLPIGPDRCKPYRQRCISGLVIGGPCLGNTCAGISGSFPGARSLYGCRAPLPAPAARSTSCHRADRSNPRAM